MYYKVLCNDGIRIGNCFTLGEQNIIECSDVVSCLGAGLEIGNKVNISANFFIEIRAPIKIDDGTIFGPYVSTAR